MDLDGHQPRFFLEEDLGSLSVELNFPRRGQSEGGAHVGMSGEGDLAGGCEDADPAGIAVLGGQDEGRLGEIELSSDLLHLLVGQTFGVRQHGQGVAGETPIGENVADCVLVPRRQLLTSISGRYQASRLQQPNPPLLDYTATLALASRKSVPWVQSQLESPPA